MCEVKYIELLLENCENIVLPRNVLGNVYIGKIYDEVARIACNSIRRVICADEVALEIFPEANTLGSRAPDFDNETTIFDRLTKYRDITHINVVYEDGTEQYICVDYNSENDDLGADNEYQKNYLSPLNVLYIVISKNKDIKDYFNSEVMLSKEYMDYAKQMYDIGV